MTDRIAVYLALIILVLLVGDFFAFQGEGTVFLMQKFLRLVDWVEFWR